MGIDGIQSGNSDELIIKQKELVQEVKEEAIENLEESSTYSVEFGSTNEDELVEFEDTGSFSSLSLDGQSLYTEEEVTEENEEVTEENEEVTEENTEDTEQVTDQNEEDNTLDMLEFKSLISSNSKLNEIAKKIGFGALFDKLDTNHDGVMDKEELKDFMGESENINDIKMSDLETFLTDSVKDLVDNVDNNENNEEKTETKAETTVDTTQETTSKDTQSVADTQSASSPVWSDYGYSTSGISNINFGGAKSLDEQIKEQEDNKAVKTQELNNKNAELSAVYDGSDTDIQEKQSLVNEAKAEYDAACSESDNPKIKEIKEEQDKNEKALTKDKETLDSANKELNDYNQQKFSLTSEKTALESEKSALESSLSALPEITDDNREKVESKKAEIKNAISKKEEEIKKKEEEIDKVQDKITTIKSDVRHYSANKRVHEEKKSELSEKMKALKDETITKALEKYENAQKNLNDTRTKKIEKIKGEISTVQNEITEIDTKINELKAQKIEKENKVSNHGEFIDMFNEKFRGILNGQGEKVAEIAEKYDIEPELLASIIALETGWGSSSLATNNYNFGGVSGTGDAGSTVRQSDGHRFAKYSSIESGLDAMARNLSTYNTRFSDVNSVDINNIDAIGRHYCEGNTWASKIRYIYSQLKNA